MQTLKASVAILSGILMICAGCATGDSAPQPTAESPRAETKPAEEPRGAVEQQEVVDNPTTRAGRGVPDLKSVHRHAAWIYIDNEEGQFIEKDGRPQVQWVISTPVSRSPTFRVEVYEQLLGSPKDFNCVLQTETAYDGSRVVYGIRAKEGTFEAGKEYSLLAPGDNFVIFDGLTKAPIDRIPLLSPGVYGIVGGVTNAQKDARGVAITYFTVGDDLGLATPAEDDEAEAPAKGNEEKAAGSQERGDPKSASEPKEPEKP